MSSKDSRNLLFDDPELAEATPQGNQNPSLGETPQAEVSEPLLTSHEFYGLTGLDEPMTSLNEGTNDELGTSTHDDVLKADVSHNDVMNFDRDALADTKDSSALQLEHLQSSQPEFDHHTLVETSESLSDAGDSAEKKLEGSVQVPARCDLISPDLISSEIVRSEFGDETAAENVQNDVLVNGHCKDEDPEEKRVDFKTGMVCTDVPTALEILKTKYKLSDVQYHRPVLTTWSCWNISDMVRGPHRESYYWRDPKRRRKEEVEQLAVDVKDETPQIKEELLTEILADIEMEEICQKIDVSHKEITEMLKKIIEHDDKERELERLELSAVQTDPVDYRTKVNPAEEITPRRRENALRRLMRALRRRLARLGGGHHSGDKSSGPDTPGYNPDSVSNEGTLKRNKAKRQDSGKSSGRSTPAQGESSSRYGSLKRFKLKRKGSGKITSEGGQKNNDKASKEDDDNVKANDSELGSPTTMSPLSVEQTVAGMTVSAQLQESPCEVEIKQTVIPLSGERNPIVIVTQASSGTLELNGYEKEDFQINLSSQTEEPKSSSDALPSETECSPTAESYRGFEMEIQTESPQNLESTPAFDLSESCCTDNHCPPQNSQDTNLVSVMSPSSSENQVNCDAAPQQSDAFDVTDQSANNSDTQNISITSEVQQTVADTEVPLISTNIPEESVPFEELHSNVSCNLNNSIETPVNIVSEELPTIPETSHETFNKANTNFQHNEAYQNSDINPDHVTQADDCDVTKSNETVLEDQRNDVILNTNEVNADEANTVTDEHLVTEPNHDEVSTEHMTKSEDNDTALNQHYNITSEHDNVAEKHDNEVEEGNFTFDNQQNFQENNRNAEFTESNENKDEQGNVTIDRDVTVENHAVNEEEIPSVYDSEGNRNTIEHLQADSTNDNNYNDSKHDIHVKTSNNITLPDAEFLGENIEPPTDQVVNDQELVSDKTSRKV